MAKYNFYLVDVFAETKYAGNQLAVIPNATDLTTLQMQQIANEGNPDVITLNLGVGQIPVSFQKNSADQEVLWMKQKPPFFGEKFTIEEIAPILQLPKECFDDCFPIQEVSTGMPFTIVPLKTLEAVKKARTNLSLLEKISNRVHGGILVFCPETNNHENNLNVRVFVDLFGIPEDPATGSGNGCLAGYLSNYRYFGFDKVDARVEQGFEIKRPSILLLLKANHVGDSIEVLVGGKVVLIGCGTFL